VVHRLNKGSAIGGNQQVSTLARAHTVIRGRLTWNGAECIALRIVHVVVVDDLLVGGGKKAAIEERHNKISFSPLPEYMLHVTCHVCVFARFYVDVALQAVQW
jgi:hypothetical protein